MTVYNRIYDSFPQAQEVVKNLEKIGVPSADISVVANQRVTSDNADADEGSATASGAGVGATLGGGAGLLAGLGLMAIPGLGPVVAAGALAATAVGAVAGSMAGGLVGALVDAGTSEEDAHLYSEAVRRGGTLVTVNTAFVSDKIDAVLDGYQPVDMSTRRAEYQREGWTRFEPGAMDSPTEITRKSRRAS